MLSKGSNRKPNYGSIKTDNLSSNSRNSSTVERLQVINEVIEPFWVKESGLGDHSSVWCDPDELCNQLLEKFVSNDDKRIFWEMSRTLIRHTDYRDMRDGGIRNPRELANILSRPEFRVLWTEDAPEYLPKEVSMYLLSSAFVNKSGDD